MKKIYTRTGDDGKTSLFGGDRVAKGHPRIDAYGTVDEVNTFIGLARAHMADIDEDKRLDRVLQHIQEDLFVVGADLATPSDAKPVVPRVKEDHIGEIESLIDAFNDELEPLEHFILPGGTPGAAALHTARTVCRRAERAGIQASASVALNERALVYLNRLSDLLFVLARWANRQAGVREDIWTRSNAARGEESNASEETD